VFYGVEPMAHEWKMLNYKYYEVDGGVRDEFNVFKPGAFASIS
jgi:hypothetical protein